MKSHSGRFSFVAGGDYSCDDIAKVLEVERK